MTVNDNIMANRSDILLCFSYREKFKLEEYSFSSLLVQLFELIFNFFYILIKLSSECCHLFIFCKIAKPVVILTLNFL